MNNCRNCEYSSLGSPSALSDICDACQCDGDTGWGGFTDNSIGKHFYSEEERQKCYEKYGRNDDDEYDDEMFRGGGYENNEDQSNTNEREIGLSDVMRNIMNDKMLDDDLGITTQGLPEELKDLFGQRRDDY